MFERLQSLDDMTELAKIPSKIEEPASLRLSLERFQAAYSDYSWVGFADPTGKILSATGGVLEGHNAKDQPWFKEGAGGAFVGDVKLHDPRSPDRRPGHDDELHRSCRSCAR